MSSFKSGTAGERPLRIDDKGHAEPVASIAVEELSTTGDLAAATVTTTGDITSAGVLRAAVFECLGNVTLGLVTVLANLELTVGELILQRPPVYSNTIPQVTQSALNADVTINQRRGRVHLATMAGPSNQQFSINTNQFTNPLIGPIILSVGGTEYLNAQVHSVSVNAIRVRVTNEAGGSASGAWLDFQY